MSQPPIDPYGQPPEQPLYPPQPDYGQSAYGYGPPTQPAGYQPPPVAPGQQPPVQQVFQPVPVQVNVPGGRVVTKQHMSGTAHTVHLVLTIFTCGAWGIVWFLHWLFTRNKTVTQY